MEKSGGVTVNLIGNPGIQLQENRYPQQGVQSNSIAYIYKNGSTKISLQINQQK